MSPKTLREVAGLPSQPTALRAERFEDTHPPLHPQEGELARARVLLAGARESGKHYQRRCLPSAVLDEFRK